MNISLNILAGLIAVLFSIFHVFQYLGLRENTRALQNFSNALLMLQSEKRSTTAELATGLQVLIESCRRQEQQLEQIRQSLGTRKGDRENGGRD